jgi:phytoene synthase
MTARGLSPLGVSVRQHDPDRYLCALFAPAAQREALFALLAFNHELARAREATSQPVAALIRLSWWREVVENARAGRPARRHEVAEPLHAALAAGALDADDLLAMVDAREPETEESIPSRSAFAAYLRGTAGGLALATARLLGARGEALVAAQQAGTLYGLAGVLRSVPALAGQGRCLLPEEALAEAGLTPHTVMAEPARAAPVVRAMAREALAAPPRPSGLAAATLPLVLARRDLKRLAAGRAVPTQRGLGDRMAVLLAGLRG